MLSTSGVQNWVCRLGKTQTRQHMGRHYLKTETRVIYQLDFAEGDYGCLSFVDEDFDLLDVVDVLLSHGPNLRDWHPPSVRLVGCEGAEPQFHSDFPFYLEHPLPISRTAKEKLDSIIRPSCVCLPLNVLNKEEDYFLLWILSATAALDKDRSDIEFVECDAGEDSEILYEAVLKNDATHGADIFRLPGRASPVFVSQAFVDLYTSADLRGLEFSSVTLS